MTIRFQALAALLAAAGLFLTPLASTAFGAKAAGQTHSATSLLPIGGGNVLQGAPGCPACAD